MPFLAWIERILDVRIITTESLRKSVVLSHEAFVLNTLKPGDHDVRSAGRGHEHHWVEEHTVIDLGKKFDLSTQTIRGTLNDLLRSGDIITTTGNDERRCFRAYAINVVAVGKTRR